MQLFEYVLQFSMYFNDLVPRTDLVEYCETFKGRDWGGLRWLVAFLLWVLWFSVPFFSLFVQLPWVLFSQCSFPTAINLPFHGSNIKWTTDGS